MPNQQDYPEQLPQIPDPNIPDAGGIRPSRISEFDLNIIQKETIDGDPEELSPVWGATSKDLVEIYVYDELNEVVGQINLRPEDPAVRLLEFSEEDQSGLGQDATPDNVLIDLADVLNRLQIPIGRYFITINFLRDEVGRQFKDDALAVSINVDPESLELETPEDFKREERKNNAGKLYIVDVSPSRKELKLKPMNPTKGIINEIREFIDPSVPKFTAQGLIDQLFGTALLNSFVFTANPAVLEEAFNFTDDNVFGAEEAITWDKFLNILDVIDAEKEHTTKERTDRADLERVLYNFFLLARKEIRKATLDALAKQEDVQIQDYELQAIVKAGTEEALKKLIADGQLDKHFKLVFDRE